jgi:xanthine dehydrogenase accessory factor
MSSADPAQSSSRGILADVVRLQQAGRTCVLAVPLWSRGSVPLRHHSKLLYRDDGTIRGTIGGGLLEAQVLAAAPQVISQGTPRVLEFDLTPTDAADSGMICGGRCAVLIEPIAPDHAPDIFAAAARAEQTGQPIVLITAIPPNARSSKLALTSHGDLLGSTGDPALDRQLSARAQQARADGKPAFIEDPLPAHLDPILPHPSLCIFGAGHISLSLAHMADLIGFRVIVVDDRSDFANTDRFPRADQVLVASVPDAFAQLPIDAKTYLVAVTRGHAMDEQVIAHALRTPARYIGMIGSKRKVASILDRLRARRFSDADIARVHAPIGLDIKAETVEEIAVSILAQLIAIRRASP